MKPRIRYSIENECWTCEGNGVLQWGWTPAGAYWQWNLGQQIKGLVAQ
jgi:hypothetical protein